MFAVVKKEQLNSGAIKKLTDGPFAAGCAGKCVRIVETGSRFELGSSVNSVSSAPGVMCAGCQDGKVYCRRDGGQFEPIYSHSANVCCIDVGEGCVLSGSWDHDATLFRLCGGDAEDGTESSTDGRGALRAGIDFEPELRTGREYRVNSDFKVENRPDNIVKRSFRHPESVWCAKIVSDTSFVTGCADGKIRVFRDFVISREIAFHGSAVRGILVEGEVIYSVENHGKVQKASVSGDILKSRDVGEFLYSICRHGDRIVAGGENGMLFVFNEDLECLGRTKLGCTSVWDVVEADGALYAGGSDGVLYLLDDREDGRGVVDESAAADDEGISAEESAAAEEGTGREKNGTKAPQLNSGIFTSGGFRYKVENNKVFIEKGGEWELIGDNTKKYDHSIPVTLGSKSYTLSFDNKDNVHEVASKFIRENKLDLQFHDDIVSHIQRNFKGVSLYKRYESIDINGIRKHVGEHPIVGMVQRVKDGASFSLFKSDPDNIYQVEALLFGRRRVQDDKRFKGNEPGDGRVSEGGAPSIPLFVVLDICKFLVSKGLKIDLSFLFRCTVSSAKEAKAFSFLMTNLAADPPFCIDLLDKKLRRLVDTRLLGSADIHFYEENKRIRSK